MPTPAKVQKTLAKMERLFDKLEEGCFGTQEKVFGLIAKLGPKTWADCRTTKEDKALTHTYEELSALLVERAVERESDLQVDRYRST